jgi:hypothetical protein
VPPWATIIIIIVVLLTVCLCLACCIRRTCRKLWKKKGVKGGKGIDLQAVKSFGLHKEKVKKKKKEPIGIDRVIIFRFNLILKN